jgi:acetylornithine deacetylase
MPSNEPLVDALARMVAFPTVSDRPITALAAYVARRCEDLGFKVDWYRDDAHPEDKANLVCTAGPPGEDGLVLSGHMDVVPTEGQPWSSDPFRLSARDGRLYGRGTADMKGFIACALDALGRIDVGRLRRQVALIWTHDEEIGCVGSARLVPKLAAAGRRLPREAIIGEPTDFRIFRMHPGHVAVDVTTRGASAHSSKPDLGANAIGAMARVVLMLEALQVELARERRLEDYLERPFVVTNSALIRGGVAVNLVPDACRLTVGYRPLPGDDPLDVARRVEARLAEMRLPAGTSAQLEVGRAAPGMLTPAGTPLERLLACHASHPEPTAAAYATDGANLSTLGMDCLIFGPGSIDVAHKADEYIDAADLDRGADALESILRARLVSK